MDHAEFVAQTLANGGASRSVRSFGTPPESGYMVSGAPDDRGDPIKTKTIAVHKFNEEIAVQHAHDLIRNTFASRTPNVYQGSWVSGNKVVLDASEHVATRLDATRRARQRGQNAVYDLAAGEDIDTRPGQHKAGKHRA